MKSTDPSPWQLIYWWRPCDSVESSRKSWIVWSQFDFWPESWWFPANWATGGWDDPAPLQTGCVHSDPSGHPQYCMPVTAGSHSPVLPDGPTSPSGPPEEDGWERVRYITDKLLNWCAKNLPLLAENTASLFLPCSLWGADSDQCWWRRFGWFCCDVPPAGTQQLPARPAAPAAPPAGSKSPSTAEETEKNFHTYSHKRNWRLCFTLFSVSALWSSRKLK